MVIEPIATFHSPLTTKFGIPRQSGVAPHLTGRIVFRPAFRREEALRGLEGFSHLWLIWEFSANTHRGEAEDTPQEGKDWQGKLTVRPPRLGGNERLGVFATRSPFRPNGLGLSCVEIVNITLSPADGPVIEVSGADLMDGTPIYDIKPYVAYSDSKPHARGGFTDSRKWEPLQVELPTELAMRFSPTLRQALTEVLAADPRPAYHDDPGRVYGLPFDGKEVKFRVAEGVVTVIDVTKIGE